ncbi:fibronectin type III domain-containing protein [Chryseobacterium terrae]|uniref:Fibronectin type III domain-containing protein n=1 Tax=Chryseobacterium terrae TaxID=3163299 RepID=A0ABW8Y4F4_9FLAO
MKGKRLFGLVNMCALFSASMAFAQYYHPVAVSGFSHDVIANGVGGASTSTTASVDAVDYAYVSKDFQATATSPVLSYGLPVSGQFMTVVGTTPGLTYQLAPYGSNNALKLNAVADTGTLTFTTPTAAYNLYFLATGGSGSGVVSAVVNFSDGTSQTFASLSVSDWYDQSNFAIQGIGRVKITTNALEDGGGINPRIYQIPLAISSANQSKTVQSITFSKTSGTGFVNIFGVSADKFTTCLAPTAVTASAVTVSSATLSWTAPATVPTNYDIYYTSSTVAPNSSTTPTVSAVTGLAANIASGITSTTKYHVWIRSNCGGSVGEWSYGTTFTTPCSTFNVPYTESFDTTPTGSSTNLTAPICWSYLETSGFTGYGYVSSTYSNSPANSYYLYNSSASSGNQLLVSPQTVGLSDGTKRVRFYARGSANYTIQVGTLTNPSDPSTFVSFNTTTITGSYAQYTVNIPSGGGSYLAFRHNLGGTYRGIYLDDITVQQIPTCNEPTLVTSSNVTANSATIGWTAPSTAPANGYDVYYSATNTAPTSATVLNATNSTTSATTSAPISGLTPITTYYVWVRSKCSSSDISEWSLSTTFTTECAAVNAPFSQTFDNGSVPNCWQNVNPTTTGTYAFWRFSGSPGYGASTSFNGRTAGTYAWVDASSPYDGVHNVQLVTPLINLTGLTQPYISFEWYKNHSSSSSTITPSTYADNKLIVEVNDGSGWVSVFNDSSNAGQWRTVGIPLSPSYIGATIQVRFTVDKDVSGNPYFYDDLLLDNIEVKQNPNLSTSESTAKKEISVYPNPFRDVVYISETKDLKTVKVFDLTGRAVKTIENPTKEINLSSLNSGLYLITMYYKDGSQNTVKAMKK